jgi:hypothetical protein
MLATVYPNYEWLPWKFDRVSVGFWDDIANNRMFLDWAAKQLKIKNFTDWYQITRRVALFESS